jgi:uncharacterized membrane-anchored protein YhcB (DUF1043 family)
VYSLTIVIVGAAAGLIIGLGLGLLLGQRSSTAGQKHREVERKLDQVLQDKKAYEDEVVEHFSDTARLLNTLTQSYRDVHNHLARGAEDLCHGNGPVAIGQDAAQRDPAEIPAKFANVQQPLDYAPKTSPDEKGMLSEGFGIDKQPAEAITESAGKA